MLKKENGITLIALIVTIVVLLILAGITIGGAINGIDDAQEDKLLAELETIQHAITQRDTKYKLTKDEDLLEGTIINDLPTLPAQKTWKLNSEQIGTDVEKKYRRIDSTNLKKLGLKPGSGSNNSTYIVNYYTGEVYNETTPETPNGIALYITIQINEN